jgi:hypothetical protein
MTFLILRPAEPSNQPFLPQPFDPLVKFILPNDQDFDRLYCDIVAQIERSHSATRARHLREGWHRRRSLGQFGKVGTNATKSIEDKNSQEKPNDGFSALFRKHFRRDLSGRVSPEAPREHRETAVWYS